MLLLKRLFPLLDADSETESTSDSDSNFDCNFDLIIVMFI